MTINPDLLPVLDGIDLEPGGHDGPTPNEDGACVMEAVAWVAGEPWSDHPDCASPVLGAFLRSWNDSLPDDDRQALKRYVPRLVGSRGTAAQEDERAWMALDWDAARDAARDAAWDAARDAAWDAARAALRPAVVELQVSAHQLVDRMLAVTEGESR